MNENVNKPSHYCEGRKYEPIDVIKDWELDFDLGNTVKYISRAGRKNPDKIIEDLEKAKYYLEHEINDLNKKNNNSEKKKNSQKPKRTQKIDSSKYFMP